MSNPEDALARIVEKYADTEEKFAHLEEECADSGEYRAFQKLSPVRTIEPESNLFYRNLPVPEPTAEEKLLQQRNELLEQRRKEAIMDNAEIMMRLTYKKEISKFALGCMTLLTTVSSVGFFFGM